MKRDLILVGVLCAIIALVCAIIGSNSGQGRSVFFMLTGWFLYQSGKMFYVAMRK